MKLTYARVAAVMISGASIATVSTCTPRGKAPEFRPPAIEAPVEPQMPEKNETAPPGDRPQEGQDGGTPGRRDRPSPHDPLRDELQTRLAMRP